METNTKWTAGKSTERYTERLVRECEARIAQCEFLIAGSGRAGVKPAWLPEVHAELALLKGQTLGNLLIDRRNECGY